MNDLSKQDQTLVIVGNGMVGWKLCQKLVEVGAIDSLRVVVFGEEPRPAYDRIHLTDLLSGKSPDNLILSPLQWYEDNGIELYIGDPVVFIDRDNCVVRSKSGKQIEYDRLVLATGSRPFVPPIEGKDLPGVFVYRTVEDLLAIMEYGSGVARAAVIGGGLLGLEAAKAVYDHGLDVHVIEFAPGLMPRQLDATGSDFLKQQIERLGVHVHVNKQTKRIEAIEGIPGGYRGFGRGARVLHFADGARLAVDMIVISAGIRPRGELAQACGLECGPNGAVVVDDHLQTSDPRIFAIGECAIHRSITYGLAAPGYRMVDVLVDNLVGGDDIFDGADRSAKLKLMGVTVASFGEHNENEAPNSTTSSFVGGGVYRKIVTRDGKLIGVVTVGDWENLDRVRASIDAPERISFWDMRRFRSTGNLWAKSETPPVYAWDADATVCACLHVKRGTLSQAYADGCTSLDELSLRTGAGTMCGSCKPLLVEFLSAGQDEPAPLSRGVSSRAGGPVTRREGMPATVREGLFGVREAPNTARDAAAAPSTRRGIPHDPMVSERTLSTRSGGSDDDALARLDAIVQLRVEERLRAAMKSKQSAAKPGTPAPPVFVSSAAASVESDDTGPVAVRVPTAWTTQPPSTDDEDSGPLSVRSPTSWSHTPDLEDDSGPLSVRNPQPRDVPGASNGSAAGSRTHLPDVSVSARAAPDRPANPAALNGGEHTDIEPKPTTKREGSQAPPAAPVTPVNRPASRASVTAAPRISVMSSDTAQGAEIDTKPSTTRREGSVPPPERRSVAAAEPVQQQPPERASRSPVARGSVVPPERISFAPVDNSALKVGTEIEPPSRHDPMSPSERVSFTSMERTSFATMEGGIVRAARRESVMPPSAERDAMLPPPVRPDPASVKNDGAYFDATADGDRVKPRSSRIASEQHSALSESPPPVSSQGSPPSSEQANEHARESTVPRRSIMPPLRPITLAPGRLSATPGRVSYAALLVPERGTKAILVASAAALVLVGVFALAEPIAFDRSYAGFSTDPLWLERFWKHFTGYSLLVVAVLSLVISLRKRWRRFSAGDVSIWRMIHGVLGTLSLLLLVLHTSLHLGHNLNRVLMIDFLALTLLGAVAGGIVGVSSSLNATTARNLRRLGSRVHIALFWPLPILVLLHVISAYYF